MSTAKVSNHMLIEENGTAAIFDSKAKKRRYVLSVAVVTVLALAVLGAFTISSRTGDRYDLVGKNKAYDFLHPGPGLNWFPKSLVLESKWTLYAGNLTVPLSPYSVDAMDTPHVDLLVMMVVPPGKDPSKLEPLLHHCGGPGSDASCVLGAMKDEFSDYVGFSISQRGIGTEALPSFECSPDSIRLPPSGKKGYDISDFTDCECALPDGTPLAGQAFANIDPQNEEQVHLLLQNFNLRSQRCATMKKWALTGPRGKVFNFLEWSGTGMLAFDIEYFRTRVGASLMNIDGGSYGTEVGAVYATKFPGSLGKLVLNGNMPPKPETQTFAEGNGDSQTQAFAHLESSCAAWTETFPCNLTQNTRQLDTLWNTVIAALRKGTLRAPTKLIATDGSPVMFPLQIGLVAAHLQGQMISAGFAPTGWTAPVLTIANLAGLQGEEEKHNQIKDILDSFCHLPEGLNGENWSGVTTWDNYGVCVGEQSVGLSSKSSLPEKLKTIGYPPITVGTGGFLNEAAVLGQDYFGRFTVSQAMRVWEKYSRNSEPMATSAVLGMLAELFAWRASPTPVQAGFRSDVRALILGNLYDPACGYAWSNHMRESLPNSVMITWQGVGHMTTEGGNYKDSGMKACLDLVKTYWKTGELPIDGFTCRVKAPTPMI